MKLLTVLLLSGGIALTACDGGGGGPTKPPIILPTYMRITIGMTAGAVVDPPLDGDITSTLQMELIKQDSTSRFEDVFRWADEIVRRRPEQIDLSVSWISVPGRHEGRPSLIGDGCGGFANYLMDLVESEGLNYITYGDRVACEEEFLVALSGDDMVEVTVTVMQFYYVLPRSKAPESDDPGPDFEIIQSAEPRWDPPSRREKRAGSRPGG
ncbi:hypothetical protein ACFL6R_03005 [Gemmatimonadota bacterium]